MKPKQLILSILSILIASSLHSQIVDSTFGTNGYVPYGVVGNSEDNLGTGNSIAVQNDGKILVAVDKFNPNGSSDLWFYTYRYNQDGTPDISFGDNGVSLIFAGDASNNKDVKVQEDGKIVVVGETEYCTGGVCGAAQFIMMRMKTDGVIDSTFGINGKILSSDIFGVSGLFAKPERVLITQDNKFLIAGRGMSAKPFIARVNNNGTMDGSFGNIGVFSDTAAYATVADLTTDNLGNTYCLILYYNQNDTINASDTYIIKLNENGVLDASFGTGGRRIFNSAAYEQPTSIAIRSDNKIVVAGHSQPVYITGFNDGYGETNEGFIIILNPDGSEASILPQGFLTYKLPDDTTTFIHKLLLTPDDKMLISGRTITKINGNYHEKAFIALLDENGILDASFNEVGFMKFDYGLHSNIGSLACFLDLELLPNQKILACGYRNPISFNTTKSLFLLKLKEVNIGDPTYTNENIDIDDEFTVFPNPALNYITVTNNSNSSSECIITVISINGQVLLTNKFENQQEMLLDVMSLAKGIYFIRIQDEEQTVVKKIMIQ